MKSTTKTLSTITTTIAACAGVVLVGAPAQAVTPPDIGVTQAAYDSVGLLMSKAQVEAVFGSHGCRLSSNNGPDGVRLVAKLYPSTTVGTWIQIGYRETPDGVLRLKAKQMAVDPYVNAAACYR